MRTTGCLLACCRVSSLTYDPVVSMIRGDGLPIWSVTSRSTVQGLDLPQLKIDPGRRLGPVARKLAPIDHDGDAGRLGPPPHSFAGRCLSDLDDWHKRLERRGAAGGHGFCVALRPLLIRLAR